MQTGYYLMNHLFSHRQSDTNRLDCNNEGVMLLLIHEIVINLNVDPRIDEKLVSSTPYSKKSNNFVCCYAVNFESKPLKTTV